MKASTHKMRRLVKLLVATVVAAAIAAPAAGARTDVGMGRVDADVWGVSEYAQPGPAVKGENYYARGLPTQAGSALPCRWCPGQSYDAHGVRLPMQSGPSSAGSVVTSEPPDKALPQHLRASGPGRARSHHATWAGLLCPLAPVHAREH